MVTDLVQIKRLGEKQRAGNVRFRSWLKSHNFVERRFKAIAEQVEEAIDCKQCANCCRVATTPLNDRDVERISRGLGMRKHEFLAQYTVETEEGVVLQRTENGCVFLNGNLCSIYEIRPQTCELFPHLVKGNRSFVSRMWHMPDRAVYCPIVFNSLEQFKRGDGIQEMTAPVIVLALALLVALTALALEHDRRRRVQHESSALSLRLTFLEQQLSGVTAARDAALSDFNESRISVARLEVEVTKANELAAAQVGLLTQTAQQLEEKFRALAAEALHANSQMLFDRARDQLSTVVQPVGDSLRQFETKVQNLENTRVSHYEGLRAQIQSMAVAQKELQQATDQLKTALRNPAHRGRWGEVQLRRVLELAGMIEHCDFQQQETLFGDRLRRPDVRIKLPNDREIAVDAKVPLDAYLRAAEAEAPFREALLADHARQVKAHVKALGEKSYWDGLSGSPEFVIAYLPLESLYSAALEHDPELLNYCVERRVLLATPTTLIALLFAVAHGWSERQLAHNAEEIRQIGSLLYKNLLTLHGRVEKLGAALNTAVGAYNEAITSFDGRVLSNARKLHELKAATGEELTRLDTLDLQAKRLTSSDWSESLTDESVR